VRKEAADAVTSRTDASDTRIDAALRRYLGTSMYEMLGRGKKKTQKDAPPTRTPPQPPEPPSKA
jgi:hypothetical protein